MATSTAKRTRAGSAAKKTIKRASRTNEVLPRARRRASDKDSNGKQTVKQASGSGRKGRSSLSAKPKPASRKSSTLAKSSKLSDKTNGASAKGTPAEGRPAAPHSAQRATAVVSAKARKAAGGNAPREAPVEVAKKSLRTLVAIVEQANDRDAEQILGDGQLEALLRGVLPPRRRGTKTSYDYLASQKRRASLMARLRHGINTAYSFPTGVDGRFISPTRVQWFYDGLTFIEGAQPFSGVVGLFRNGECRYGLDVQDLPPNDSLGPSESDFVSVAAAKRSFDAAAEPANAGLDELGKLFAGALESTEPWLSLLERHPWMLGAQHLEFVRPSKDDENMPHRFAQRIEDLCHDLLLMRAPSASVFGGGGRLQRSFQELLHQAEQRLTFVQRQVEYLEREFNVAIRRPRAFVIAGHSLDRSERDALRHYTETRHAELRVLTFDDLVHLARRTLAFFEPRFGEKPKR